MTDRLPTLLLTRPAEQSEDFANLCRSRIRCDLPVLVSPILTIETSPPKTLPEDCAFLVLTSANAVAAIEHLQGLRGLTAYCVGDRTAERARKAGLSTISAGGAAADLVARIRADRPPGTGLWLRGRRAARDVAEALCSAGTETKSLVVYDQVATPLSSEAKGLLAGDAPVILPLFSPRSAALVAREAVDARAPLTVVAMSPQVAAAWTGPIPVHAVTAAPTAEAMLDAISGLYLR